MEFDESTVSSSGIEEIDAAVTVSYKLEPPLDMDTSVTIASKEDVATGHIEEVASSTDARDDEAKNVAKENVVAIHDEKVMTNGHANGSVPTIKEHDDEAKTVAREPMKSWPALWLMDRKFDERVIKLIYWCEWQKTAGIFGSVMFLLLSLTRYSFLTVGVTMAMALLLASFLYRIGKTILNAVQKSSTDHPLWHLLEQAIELDSDTVQQWSEVARVRLNRCIRQAQDLFLIRDIIESLKFGITLWLLSHVTAWFSLLTMIIVAVAAVFSLPKIYDMYQVEIDQGVSLALVKLAEVKLIVESKIPTSVAAYTKKIQ